MRSSPIAFGLAVAISLATPALAQSRYAPANQPVFTPKSAVHMQAQLNNEPGRCGKEVSRMQDQVGLRTQQWATGAETRGSVIAALDAASNAASAGDDEACWHWYDRAQATVR